MAQPFFQFKQFTVHHHKCAMKVTTDACLFGAWTAGRIRNLFIPDAHESSERKGIRNWVPDASSLLDIGTGTGLLSLMVAQKNEVRIDAVEIDTDAASQATENVEQSPWKDRIRVVQADILHFIPGKKYDFIVSNPPFYENELESPAGAKNVAHHTGGLLLAQLVHVIRENLSDDGYFFLLLPYKRMAEAMQLLGKEKLYVLEKVLVRATAKHQPTRVMVMGGKYFDEMKESVLDIKDGNNYTMEFVRLLRDFYLYL